MRQSSSVDYEMKVIFVATVCHGEMKSCEIRMRCKFAEEQETVTF